MADVAATSEQLALLLQASRDFAFQQVAQRGHFVPFATRAKQDGEIDFIRLADETTQTSLEELYDQTQLELAAQAQQGEILAAACVVHIQLAEQDGSEAAFPMAIRVHVEAPGYSRMVIAPYRIDPPGAEGEKPYLVDGEMITLDTGAVVFAG